MSKMSKKKVIGITGSMGSGKSEISRYLRKKYPVLDCDQVNADLLKKGNLGYQKLNDLRIVELDSNGQIIKESLASYMFSKAEHRKQVEAILHPLIFEQMHKWIYEQESSIVFVEMPILFEISAQDHFDSIWCVVADLDVALSRLQTYRNFTREQALARLVSQMNPEEKMGMTLSRARCDAADPTIVPPPPPAPGQNYGAPEPPPSAPQEAAYVSEALKLNPGTYEELHKKCKEIFPLPFEGAKFVLNKSLNQGFHVSHSVALSSTNPSGYRFGSTYVGTKMVNTFFTTIYLLVEMK